MKFGIGFNLAYEYFNNSVEIYTNFNIYQNKKKMVKYSFNE